MGCEVAQCVCLTDRDSVPHLSVGPRCRIYIRGCRPVERGLPGAGYSRRRLMPSEPGHYIAVLTPNIWRMRQPFAVHLRIDGCCCCCRLPNEAILSFSGFFWNSSRHCRMLLFCFVPVKWAATPRGTTTQEVRKDVSDDASTDNNVSQSLAEHKE